MDVTLDTMLDLTVSLPGLKQVLNIQESITKAFLVS